MKRFVLTVMVLGSLMLTGCAGRVYNSSFGISNPAETVSIPHPKHDEANGVKKVTLTQGVLPDRFLPELIRNNGVFNAVVCKKDKPSIGKVMVIPSQDELPMNLIGEILTQAKFDEPAEVLAFNKIVVPNHDGTVFARLDGTEIYAKDENGKLMPVDPEKFDKDEVYRKGICDQGHTLVEHIESQAAKDQKYGMAPRETTLELEVGTDEWKAYKLTLYNAFKETYSTPTGDWRIGTLDIDTYKFVSTEIPGHTWFERVMKRMNVGTSLALSMTGYGAFIAVGDVVATGVNAAIEQKATSVLPLSSRVELKVRDMQPNFEMLARAYRSHILKLVAKNRYLEKQIAEAKSTDKVTPAQKPASTKVSARR